jgi:hypothetical protein
MQYNAKFACWSLLFFGIMLPFALRALKWLMIKLNGRFEPDFLGQLKTLFFKSIKDYVNYNSGDNFWTGLTIVIVFLFSGSPTKLLFRLFPGVTDLPDIVASSLGIVGIIAALTGLIMFLRDNKPS